MIPFFLFPQAACLPPLQWDDELAEVAQVWADQCAVIMYGGPGGYPGIHHDRGAQRATSRYLAAQFTDYKSSSTRELYLTVLGFAGFLPRLG